MNMLLVTMQCYNNNNACVYAVHYSKLQSLFYSFCLLVTTSLLFQVTARTVYITPDDDNSTNTINTCALSHCISNAQWYFTSNTQLVFQPEIYYLKEDFILKNKKYIAINGNSGIIKCASSTVGLAIIKVTNIVIKDIQLVNCGKNYTDILLDSFNYLTVDVQKLHWHAAIQLHNCTSLVVNNISITVEIGTHGIVVVNAVKNSEFNNVHITVLSSQLSNSTTSGVMIFYCNLRLDIFWTQLYNSLDIDNFVFMHGSKRIQNAFFIMFYRNKLENYVTITNVILRDLCNVKALYYYSYFNVESSEVEFRNCYIGNNTYTQPSVLFTLQSWLNADNSLILCNVTVYKNANLSSVITVENGIFSNTFNVFITSSIFTYNHVMNIIKDIHYVYINEESKRPTRIVIYSTTISSNTHRNGIGMISVHYGKIEISEVEITNNSYYENIVELDFSYMIIKDYLHITC